MNEGSPYRVSPQKVKKGTRLVAVTSNPLDVVNKATGEVVGAVPYMGRRVVRDISDFVKLYDASVLVGMNLMEVKVFAYILMQLSFEDKFVFEEEACEKVTGLKRSAVYAGLRGLAEKDIIKKDKRGSYWINPNIAYRGSRDELMRLA